MPNDLTPDPQTVEIYKGIDCCDEVQTELQIIIQDIATLQGQCDNLRNLMTQQHGAIEQKLQTIEQQIIIIERNVKDIFINLDRLQAEFGRYVLQFGSWMNWIATALNQINNCTCGKTQPLPPPPKIG